MAKFGRLLVILSVGLPLSGCERADKTFQNKVASNPVLQSTPEQDKITSPLVSVEEQVRSWNPKFIKQRMGNPNNTPHTLKFLYPLYYDGLGFIFHVDQDDVMRDDDDIESIAFFEGQLTTAAQEFANVIPKGLRLGCTIKESEAVLGKLRRVETENIQGQEYVWHTYHHSDGDWRNYWLRFVDGKLVMINISFR